MGRQILIEDITELTPRRGATIVHVKIDKPPELEEVDAKIDQLVDMMAILEGSLDKLEQEYFQDIEPIGDSDIDAQSVDENWNVIQNEYNKEFDDKEKEYQALLRKIK
ncbi:hypothetical protein GPJ56_010136 [Histomonas meleagridis]|uniref:uncharacterized protein n=1 Tax=Histomonas meleagridis TaxID=135588 RepID=UPI00355A2A52|nr:hypothetical protein GPJ56_010136 [Histomonas meleagridis]KAH0806793.1 hypothetical protein GO595_000436 [Histomonas meleagridis]